MIIIDFSYTILLLLILLIINITLLKSTEQQLIWIDLDDNIIIDHNNIIHLNNNQQETLLLAQKDDDHVALNNIGLAFLQDTSLGKKNITQAIILFEKAIRKGSISAANNLGKIYFERKNNLIALDYFKIAANKGHQGALYHCGLIYAEGTNNTISNYDLVTALEYFQMAYINSDTSSSSLAIKDAAYKSHNLLIDRLVAISNHDFTIIKRLWYASILIQSNNSNYIDVTFNKSIELLSQFNETFINSKGSLTNSSRSLMNEVVNLLGSLVEKNLEYLNNVQIYIALDNIQDMIGPLAGKDNNFAYLAGVYSEAYALTHYCYNNYAIKEVDSACFNGAASASISYYRRANASNNIKRIFAEAKNHPKASTKWIYQSQTPRVFHEGLQSKPWWYADNFSLVKELKVMYKNNLQQINTEIDNIISLNEGSLRTGGSVTETIIDESTGLQRIFTYLINSTETVEQYGSGGWSEFGPLFDGITWSKKCKFIPLICNTLKKHMQNSKEICGSTVTSSNIDISGNKIDQYKITATDIENMCGSDTIVTILRLKPDTHILPHCGTTNRRLIMHFALRGSDGVEFRVGNETRGYKHDGNAIVFDDSYEHEVYHAGKKDRYILLVVLAHPETYDI